MAHPWAKRAQIRETGRKKINRDFLSQILPEMAVHCQPAPSAEKEMKKLLSLFLRVYARKALLPEKSFCLSVKSGRQMTLRVAKFAGKVPRILF